MRRGVSRPHNAMPRSASASAAPPCLPCAVPPHPHDPSPPATPRLPCTFTDPARTRPCAPPRRIASRTSRPPHPPPRLPPVHTWGLMGTGGEGRRGRDARRRGAGAGAVRARCGRA
ncbi:hypothetical protein GUJ93_ZPchr0009g1538 [Zizania palustris]|uniref:Uncharacterized protein n=1 Tax=Zizania palustris TaxID=103762 RepID=A0A8J5RNY3_ZIZPA|nr:hypothetical protein GUJ93_ZPchr0009g1538 [Zizania palustris]